MQIQLIWCLVVKALMLPCSAVQMPDCSGSSAAFVKQEVVTFDSTTAG